MVVGLVPLRYPGKPELRAKGDSPGYLGKDIDAAGFPDLSERDKVNAKAPHHIQAGFG